MIKAAHAARIRACGAWSDVKDGGTINEEKCTEAAEAERSLHAAIDALGALAAVTPAAPEPNIPKGSGVQPPDGSTERPRTNRVPAKDELLRIAAYFRRIGDLWEGPDGVGTRGTDLCQTIAQAAWTLAHERMALGLTEIPPIAPAPATAGASENSGPDEPNQGDHLSEQPSVDRCMPLVLRLERDSGGGFDNEAPAYYTPERLAQWLDAKYARHKEYEDKAAANLIRQFARLWHAAVNQQASEPHETKESGESGVREALARLVALHDERKTMGVMRAVPWMLDNDDAWEAARSALALHSGASARSAEA